MTPLPGHGALPVRRSRLVESERLTAVVVEIDATREPEALAVLQASLHPAPEGHRLVFGYRLAPSGLGEWVGDRRVRLTVWPALVDEHGEVIDPASDHAEDHRDGDGDGDGPGTDRLVIDLDPVADATALDDLARVGRLVVAGPDAGPVPLVLDIDRQLLADVRRQVSPTA